MVKKNTQNYAKKILWEINIPKGIRGASIESFNIERLAEAEFLMQKQTLIIIDKAEYNIKKDIWILHAIVTQKSLSNTQ